MAGDEHVTQPESARTDLVDRVMRGRRCCSVPAFVLQPVRLMESHRRELGRLDARHALLPCIDAIRFLQLQVAPERVYPRLVLPLLWQAAEVLCDVNNDGTDFIVWNQPGDVELWGSGLSTFGKSARTPSIPELASAMTVARSSLFSRWISSGAADGMHS